MPSPLPSLSFATPPMSSKRKRSNSTLEILTIAPPYDIKKARTGIQELSTDDSPPVPSLSNSLSSAATADSPETLESTSSTSSDLLSESSSSGDESSEDLQLDQGYDSDSEAGSTSTSSSSSSSNDAGDNDELRPRSSSTFASPPVSEFQQSTQLPSLNSRLKAFIPTLAAANAQLEHEREEGTLGSRDIENVDTNHYIEMDLGLGVLEEKRGSAEISDTDSDDDGDADDGDDDANDAEDESEMTDATQLSSRKKKRRMRKENRDIMGKLMGKRADGEARNPGITVVDDDDI